MKVCSIINNAHNCVSQIAETLANIDQAKVLHYGWQFIDYGRQKPVASLITTIATIYSTVVLSSFVLGAFFYFVGKIIKKIPFINNFWFVENVADWFKTKGEKAMFFSIQLIHFVFIVSIKGVFAPIGKCISQYILNPICRQIPISFLKGMAFLWKDDGLQRPAESEIKSDSINSKTFATNDIDRAQRFDGVQELSKNLKALFRVITELQIAKEDKKRFLADIHVIAEFIRFLKTIKPVVVWPLKKTRAVLSFGKTRVGTVSEKVKTVAALGKIKAIAVLSFGKTRVGTVSEKVKTVAALGKIKAIAVLSFGKTRVSTVSEKVKTVAALGKIKAIAVLSFGKIRVDTVSKKVKAVAVLSSGSRKDVVEGKKSVVSCRKKQVVSASQKRQTVAAQCYALTALIVCCCCFYIGELFPVD
jgi:hypothetical protein